MMYDNSNAEVSSPALQAAIYACYGNASPIERLHIPVIRIRFKTCRAWRAGKISADALAAKALMMTPDELGKVWL